MDRSVVVSLPSIKMEDKEIGYPTMRQVGRIEILKQQFTEGRYALLTFSKMKTTEDFLDTVDAVSFLGVLLGEDNVCNAAGEKDLLALFDRDPNDQLLVEIKKEYQDKYLPFFAKVTPAHTRGSKAKPEPEGEVSSPASSSDQ